nr:ATP-grasp domain-containing protein [Actinacidiphila soli]
MLDRRIVSGSRHAVYGRLDTAPLDRDPREREVRRFADRLLATVGESLPSAVTVDVGLAQDPDTGHERWAVVEANMPWFSHSYAARIDAVLAVVLRAAGPGNRVPLVNPRSCARRRHAQRYRSTFYRYVLLYWRPWRSGTWTSLLRCSTAISSGRH